ALSGVARARQRAGLVAISEMLRGVDSERTRRLGLHRLATFGLLSRHPHDWVLALLRGLLAAGWIDLTPTEYPVPLLTPTGAEVMRGTGPVRFVFPAGRTAYKADARPKKEQSKESIDKLGSLGDRRRAVFER